MAILMFLSWYVRNSTFNSKNYAWLSVTVITAGNLISDKLDTQVHKNHCDFLA